MSLDQPAASMNQAFDDPIKQTSHITSSVSGELSYLVRWVWPLLKTILGAGGLCSLLWAAYTYSDQQVEQRRQDFLQAFNLVDTHVGEKFVKLVTDTIIPIATTEDKQWWSARIRADNAHANIALIQSTGARADFVRLERDKNDEQAAMLDMQSWVADKILAKGNGKDIIIHNYQNALNTFRFLYWYAKADPCNAAVVVFKFQKTASDFWYYFPGEYDFSGPKVKGTPKPNDTIKADDPEQLADLGWGIAQANKCAESLKPPTLPFIQQIQQRIFSEG
jgi:hypothetical protein